MVGEIDRSAAGSTMIERATALAPQIAKRAAEIDATRELPPDLAAALADAGLFKLLVPPRFGGSALALPELMEIVERVAGADGSTGWCVAQGAVFAMISAWLDDDPGLQVFGPPRAVVANGPPGDGRAVGDGGAYRVTGTWWFSSGCRHATWLAAPARIEPGRGLRWLLVPASEARIDDVWDVVGLRGTGSHRFRLREHRVPAELAVDLGERPRDADPIYRVPLGLAFACSFASVALGIARAALDHVVELASGKVPRFTHTVLRDDPGVQHAVGEADTRLRAARAFLLGSVGDVWAELVDAEAIAHDQRISLRAAGTHAIREAARVVDAAYELCATDGIYRGSEIHRRFHDMRVLSQHAQGRASFYRWIGRHRLGFPFEPGPLS